MVGGQLLVVRRIPCLHCRLMHLCCLLLLLLAPCDYCSNGSGPYALGVSLKCKCQVSSMAQGTGAAAGHTTRYLPVPAPRFTSL